jgi:hypothetical protein
MIPACHTFPFSLAIMFSSEDSSALQSHFQKQKSSKQNAASLVPQQYVSFRDSTITLEDKPLTPPPTKLGWRFIGVFFALCVVNLVCAIDATILAVALPVCIVDWHTQIMGHTDGFLLDNIYCP